MGLRVRVVLENGVYRLEYFDRGSFVSAEVIFTNEAEAIEAARVLDESTVPLRTIARNVAIVIHDTITDV